VSATTNFGRRFWVLAALSLGPAVATSFARFAYALILPAMRAELDLSYSQAGSLNTSNALGYLVGALLCTHYVSRLGNRRLFSFGLVVTVLALLGAGLAETFIGQMRFANEVHAQFDCSFVIPFHSFMEIVGSEATLNIPKPFKPEVNEKIFITRDDKTETIKVKGQELYIGEVEDMADAILLGKAPRISLDDSRANVATIFALLESARVGKPVSL